MPYIRNGRKVQCDTAQRLIRGSVAGSHSSTNRVQGRLHDERGNMLQLPEGNTLEYDELAMVRQENGDRPEGVHVYTADDEIAIYDATMRGEEAKPTDEPSRETRRCKRPLTNAPAIQVRIV